MKDSYLSLKVSPENKPVLLEALHIAAAMNDLDGAQIEKAEARSAEAFRRILIEWLLEARIEYRTRLSQDAMASRHAAQALLALERDGFYCRKCQHSRVSLGGVRAVRIVTPAMVDPRKLDEIRRVWPAGGDVYSNMITLCGACADDLDAMPLPNRSKLVSKMLRAVKAEQAILDCVPGCLLYPAHAEEERGAVAKQRPVEPIQFAGGQGQGTAGGRGELPQGRG